MSLNTIKGVIFDGGGVFSFAADAGGARYWEHRLGLLPGGLKGLISPELNRQANLGQVSEEEVWAQALAPFGLDARARAWISDDFWAGAYLDYDVALLIQDVHGCRTALLSNAWIGARASHTALGWDRLLCFDVQMFSAEEGLMKPDPAIYLRCLERLGVTAGEALFIDDTLANVEAARRLGMAGVHFTDKWKQVKELRRMLLLRG
jgi:putative hydrolase of the HAD superfamily